MNWLSRLLSTRPTTETLDSELREALADWQKQPRPDSGKPHFETRYVILNTGASEADPANARLLAVAAIALEGSTLRPEKSFHAVLDQQPVEALSRLLEFTAQGPVVVYNASLNRVLLENAFEQHLGVEPDWLWLDLYWLLPALFDERMKQPTKLASWLAVFGIDTFRRQHALGDAYAIALLMLAVQARALRRGLVSARNLIELERTRRHLSGR